MCLFQKLPVTVTGYWAIGLVEVTGARATGDNSETVFNMYLFQKLIVTVTG
jgi:hypothetical protein